MKTNILFISSVTFSLLLAISLMKVTSVMAQTDATSTDTISNASSTDSNASSTESDIVVVPQTPASDVVATSTETDTQTTADQNVTFPQPASSGVTPSNLKLVHIIGTKYVDYFTDGTSEYSFPGDPNIDSNFNKPNAPIPTHGNLTWTGTRGYPLYDTANGDLEVGQYAQQSDGTYVVHYPTMKYSSATTTEKIFTSKIVTTQIDPSSQPLEGFTVGQ